MLNPLQSLLFAAGLRPTPAQATAVSWVSFFVGLVNGGCLVLIVFLLRTLGSFCWHADSTGWDAACGEAHL